MWFLTWTALVLLAVLVLGALGWRAYGKAKALLAQVAATLQAAQDATDQANRDFDGWLAVHAAAEAPDTVQDVG